MKLDPILTKATNLIRSGKNEAAVRTLEPEVNRYHGSFRYYYLLGSACLRAGDFGGALTYFRLAHETKRREPLALLGLAVLYLRRGETDKAVDSYLEAQELDGKNKIVQKAMRVIRRYSGDNFSAWLESGRLPSLYPPVPPAGAALPRLLAIAAAGIAALALAGGILVWRGALPNPFKAEGNRVVLDAAEFNLSREDRSEPVQISGSWRNILTQKQALDTYEKALALFINRRDEAARININRLLESNAPGGIKNKSRIMLSYMEVPGLDTFKRGDNTPYADVFKDPALYRGVHVIWRGMAANIERSADATSFDFLVGYDTRKTLEGIVPVTFDAAFTESELNDERPLEVLGRIAPVSGESAIRLEGIAIHLLGRPGKSGQ